MRQLLEEEQSVNYALSFPFATLTYVSFVRLISSVIVLPKPFGLFLTKISELNDGKAKHICTSRTLCTADVFYRAVF